MNITKYPQSCFILEKNGQRIIIDPGNFVAEKYKIDDLPEVEGILITHRHADHLYPPLVQALSRGGTVPVIANQDVAELLGDGIVTNIVRDGEELGVAGFTVKAYERPHVLMPDGSEGPQNTGFMVDDTFFHGGDTADVNGISAKVAAIPIAGPDISPRDAFRMAQEINPEIVIPMHYNYFIADPAFFSQLAKTYEANYVMIPLSDGKTIEA